MSVAWTHMGHQPEPVIAGALGQGKSTLHLRAELRVLIDAWREVADSRPTGSRTALAQAATLRLCAGWLEECLAGTD